MEYGVDAEGRTPLPLLEAVFGKGELKGGGTNDESGRTR
jgi:hypothetical protein